MDSFLEAFKVVVPVLKHSLHKGECGRIGIIGGSKEYTGAPYFAAVSAMRAGADMSHVFTPPSAAVPIKSYNPDIIVHPLLIPEETGRSIEEVNQWYPRLHSLVIGPGLGREPQMMELVKSLVEQAVRANKNIVIDADGLYLIQHCLELIQGRQNVILTPNMVEFRRLLQESAKDTDSLDGGNLLEQSRQLASNLGNVTIVCKGPTDIITNGNEVIECRTQGSSRRVSGQGDILSGSAGLFLFWAKKAEESGVSIPVPSTMLAAYAACHLVRSCNSVAFQSYKRSMMSSDMIAAIPEVIARDFET